MANSAFTLSSNLGSDGKSIRTTKTQASHGFSAGSVVRFVQHAGGGSGDFKLAQADGGITAEAIGIVESVSASGNEFTVVYGGEIDTSAFITASGAQPTGSDVWFLDPVVSGGLTSTAPVSSGQIIKPVLTLLSGTDEDKGLVTNYLGTVIGGSNTVSLDTVHPVGEIIAFAGSTSDVPSGWQLCDGSTLDASTYSTYYSRVGTKYGYHSEIVFQHRGNTGFADSGNTANQDFGSSGIVESDVLSWSHTSSGGGGTGTVLLDVDVLVPVAEQTQGGETSTDNTGYPHGLIYDSSRFLSMQKDSGGATYTVDSASVKYVKTPDLTARVILGAGAAKGTFDGYTAGQLGGAEDADTTDIADSGSGLHVYTAKSATSANLKQPFMASNYIIRISDTAQAALIDGVNVSLADVGLTDHDTTTAANGDFTVYDGSLYKPLRLLDEYPSDPTVFEENFRIRNDNGYISIGHNIANFPLHVKGESPELRVQDLSANHTMRMAAQNAGVFISSTRDDSPLYISKGGGSVWAIVDKPADDTTQLNRSTIEVSGTLDVAGNIEVEGETKFQGQAYTELESITTSTNFEPNFANGIVQKWSRGDHTQLTVKNPLNQKAGGMYTIILDNNNTQAVILTFQGNFKFANGIKPNLVRAGSELVISAVCIADGTLLCTWAEDFS